MDKQFKEMEKLLQYVNDSFAPIYEDMEKDLKELEYITGVTETYDFTPITMEDIENA